MKCQRCGTGEEGWAGDRLYPTKFIGGVSVLMCPACVTDCDGIIQVSQEYKDIIVCDAKLEYLGFVATAGTPASEDEVIAASLARLTALQRMRVFSLECVKPITP